jgi:hypothetical protein
MWWILSLSSCYKSWRWLAPMIRDSLSLSLWWPAPQRWQDMDWCQCGFANQNYYCIPFFCFGWPLLLGHVPPHGGVLAAQHQLKKSNTYQPLIEVRIQRLRCLLERYKGENPSHFGGCVWQRAREKAKNMAAAVRGWENRLEHHNQVRRGKEEEEVNLSRFLSSDRSVFKLVFGGSNVFGLAPNSVSSFLTLSTSIWLYSLRFGSVEVQIWEQFVRSDCCSFSTEQFWETKSLGRQTVSYWADFWSVCWELICLLVYQVSCCLDLRFESSLLIAEEDRNCDISVFVVSYLLWLLLLLPVGNEEKCVVISRGSRETLYQDCS